MLGSFPELCPFHMQSSCPRVADSRALEATLFHHPSPQSSLSSLSSFVAKRLELNKSRGNQACRVWTLGNGRKRSYFNTMKCSAAIKMMNVTVEIGKSLEKQELHRSEDSSGRHVQKSWMRRSESCVEALGLAGVTIQLGC